MENNDLEVVSSLSRLARFGTSRSPNLKYFHPWRDSADSGVSISRNSSALLSSRCMTRFLRHCPDRSKSHVAPDCSSLTLGAHSHSHSRPSNPSSSASTCCATSSFNVDRQCWIQAVTSCLALHETSRTLTACVMSCRRNCNCHQYSKFLWPLGL